VLDSSERGRLARELARKHATPLHTRGGAKSAAGLGGYGGGSNELYSSDAVDEREDDLFEVDPGSFEQHTLRNAGPDDEGIGASLSSRGADEGDARDRRLFTLVPSSTSARRALAGSVATLDERAQTYPYPFASATVSRLHPAIWVDGVAVYNRYGEAVGRHGQGTGARNLVPLDKRGTALVTAEPLIPVLRF
jgi:hypothetical protein